MDTEKNKTRVLLIKTGALGDVLRTTSVLAGLMERYGPGLELEWLTAVGARPLLDGLAGEAGPIHALYAVNPKDAEEIAELGAELAERGFDRVLSFDDEPPLCALATRVAGGAEHVESKVLGAYMAADGQRAYTPSSGAWFDMGLLSVHGKQKADQLKIENQRSHPEIYAEMLGISMGEPQLVLPEELLAKSRERLDAAQAEGARGLRVGLNTGAGGRWPSKALPEGRVVELAQELDRRLASESAGAPLFVLLGGPEERERNARLAAGLQAAGLGLFEPGCDNSLLEFAALVDGLDLMVTSDSLALHMATARQIPTVAFFAPTSAAEIELYGRGVKVASTSPDACSYARDAETSTLTVERLAAAAEQTLHKK